MVDPAKAKRFRELSLKVIQHQRRQIKSITQTKNRYNQRIRTMKQLLTDLKSKNLISDNGADAVNVSIL